MPDIAVVIGFVFASLVVLLMLEPGIVYVITRSLTQGRSAGL
jgi:threonine/homoserine/homoserine lactone efflux protein